MDSNQQPSLPTFEDIQAAATVLEGVANKTPVITSRTLNNQMGAMLNEGKGGAIEVFLKCENFQRMGAFKFRGGYNSLSNFTEEQRKAGCLTFSSGNHAQAIALSGQLLGIQTTIIMPHDAPTLKLEATKGYGGNVVIYDRYKENREEIANKMKEENPQLSLIPPFNHPHVIAGQGTAGLELLQDEQVGGKLDHLFVCVGGGGLISGCALAAEHLAPNCKVYGVEPEAGNDAQQSLESGQIVALPSAPKTIADGAQTTALGNLTFAIIQRLVKKIITVTDSELIDEMRFLGERMKLVVEPTGCLAVAGLRKILRENAEGKETGIEIKDGERVGCLISGGNVDLQRYARLISTGKDQVDEK